MNDLVKFSNDLNSLKELSRFTVEEADVFFKCILAYQDGKSVLLYNDVRTELDYIREHGEQYFISKCRTMLKKIAKISFEYENPKTKDWMLYPSIFSKLEIHSTAKGDAINSLEFEVHPAFKNWFIDLKRYLTTFNYTDYVAIKTQYTKHLFRHLRQFRTQGWWYISLEDYFDQTKNMTMPGFRTLLGIPDSYKYSNIKKRIIIPAVDELGSVNQSLKSRVIDEYKRKGHVLTKVEIVERENSGAFSLFHNLTFKEIKKTGSKLVIALKFEFAPQQPKRSYEENIERKKRTAQQPSNNIKGQPIAQTAKEVELEKQNAKLLAEVKRLKAQQNNGNFNTQQQDNLFNHQPASLYCAERQSLLAQKDMNSEQFLQNSKNTKQPQQNMIQSEQQIVEQPPVWMNDVPMPDDNDPSAFQEFEFYSLGDIKVPVVNRAFTTYQETKYIDENGETDTTVSCDLDEFEVIAARANNIDPIKDGGKTTELVGMIEEIQNMINNNELDENDNEAINQFIEIYKNLKNDSEGRRLKK